MPSTTLLDIPPAEQAQMRAVLRRARYGYLLAFHILLLCADGRNPTEIAAFLFCSRSSGYRIVRASCRERVVISVVAVSLKKKKKKNKKRESREQEGKKTPKNNEETNNKI